MKPSLLLVLAACVFGSGCQVTFWTRKGSIIPMPGLIETHPWPQTPTFKAPLPPPKLIEPAPVPILPKPSAAPVNEPWSRQKDKVA